MRDIGPKVDGPYLRDGCDNMAPRAAVGRKRVLAEYFEDNTKSRRAMAPAYGPTSRWRIPSYRRICTEGGEWAARYD